MGAIGELKGEEIDEYNEFFNNFSEEEFDEALEEEFTGKFDSLEVEDFLVDEAEASDEELLLDLEGSIEEFDEEESTAYGETEEFYPLEEITYEEERIFDEELFIESEDDIETDEEIDWTVIESEQVPDIPAGREEISQVPFLRRHTGIGPDLILSWNDMMGRPQSVDVVVHLHGYSLRAGKPLHLTRDIVPRSGLDWFDPERSDSVPGRTRPTLALLPKGHFFKGKSGRAYTFPALVTESGLRQLIDFGLSHFAQRIGATNVVLRRLIFTAHSGGGAALLRLLRHNDPHEVHIFDGLYQDPSQLIRWSKVRIAKDQEALAAGEPLRRYMSERGGALRILYGSSTKRHSLTVHRALAAAIPSGSELTKWYRVEQTSVGHILIPRRYGWCLLANAAADLPTAFASRPLPAREAYSEEEANPLLESEAAISRLSPDQRAWILALDRSAIELMPDLAQRRRFLSEIDWSQVHFPGNTKRPSDWKLAEDLFNAMAVVTPERRVPMSINYRNVERVVVPVPDQSSHKLYPEARDMFVQMRNAASAEGIQLHIRSSWRNQQIQEQLRENQPNPKAVARLSAHMYGLAIDLRLGMPGLNIREANTRTPEKMANIVRMYRSPVYKWMALRAREFGWYPYRREPWHWEYNPPGLKERFEGSAQTIASTMPYTSATPQPTAELVSFAQRVLNATEGERLDDDGILGRLMRGALERFRRKYNLGTGGVLDERTQIALAQKALEEIAQQSLFPQPGRLDTKTQQALIGFKSQRGLASNAILDTATRTALTGALSRRISVARAPVGQFDKIIQVAEQSEIARYRWRDRGIAPSGYIKGMALVYARVYCKLKAGDAAAKEMAKANTENLDKDALAHYAQKFYAAGMRNDSAGVATLRHLFVLLIGLGMRESSGRYCAGRDRSASNTTADTAEAGLFQTSYNLRGASPLLPQLFQQYSANPSGFVDVFQEGVRCSNSDLENFGTGNGREFQRLSKTCPAFATEFTAVGLRTRRKHWGPINRKVAEIHPECNAMLLQVQRVVDEFNLCPVLQ